MTYEDRVAHTCASLRAFNRHDSERRRETKAKALALILEQARMIVRLENDVVELEMELGRGTASRLAA